MSLAFLVKIHAPRREAVKTYVYMLRCADGSLYTGWTADVWRRLKEHNEEGGKGAKYTRARRPCELVYYEEFEHEDSYEAKREAMRREWEIKHRLDKKEKEALIASFGS